MKKINVLNRYKPYQIVTAFIIVVAIAVVGIMLLFQSHAASNLVLGDYEGAGNVAGVEAFAAETKTTVGIAADYESGSTWSTIESGYPASSWTGTPYLLQLGVPMLPSSGASLVTGATGAYNSYFTTLAQNLVKAGEGNAILRIGWEWDESGNPWYASGSVTNATAFATYWQQIVTAMRAVPGANFNYSWYFGDAATNGVPGAATAITNDAYPGSSYVSSISLDFYDQTWTGSCNLPYNITSVPTPASQVLTSTQSQCAWNDGYLPALNGLTSFASSENKPIGITEWGVLTRSDGHGLGDDPAYVNNFSTWMKANNVTYASYFDFNPGLSNGGDAVLSHYPNSLTAYSTDFGSSSTTTPPTVNPPSVPGDVSAAVNNSTSVTVSWSPSTDTGGPGLGGYNIYRNGSSTKIGTATATSTSFTDTTALPSTSYTYTVQAFDTSNPAISSTLSAASSPVTTPATPLPLPPTGVKATPNSSTSVTVSWSPSTDTGGPGISGYNVYRGGVKLNSSLITTTSYTDTTVIANTTYSYTVEAVDKNGASSVASTAAPAMTPALPDTTPPSTPGGVKATASSPTSVSISWNASTDSSGGGGIAGYYILRSTSSGPYTTLSSVTSTSYTDNSVSASTSYSYEIVAFDVAGNQSVNNTAVPVTTPAATVTPPAPSAPSSVTATAVTTSQINIAWSDSSTGVTTYNIYQVGNSSPIAAGLPSYVSSYGDSGLNSSTSYSFYVVAYDGSVASANSATVSATTQAVPASQTYAAGTITGLASKCVDNNSNNIELYACNGTGAQKWTYNPTSGTLTNSNGRCLAVEGNGTKSGTLVILWKCDGSSGQVWSVKSAQGVAGAIVNPHSGLCLDDKSSGTSNGNQIWVYSCNGTGAQKWTVN